MRANRRPLTSARPVRRAASALAHARQRGQLCAYLGWDGESAQRCALLFFLVAMALAPDAASGAGEPAAGDSAGAAIPPLRTVEHVDLERYVGRWYEISRIPNWFQASCARGTTATYTLGADGRIEVVNRCLRADGSENDARGIARVIDPATNARLKVSFVRFLGKSFFWGDYWVIGLGADYEYALVGTPDRKFGWVLARTPALAPDVLARIDAELRAQGYDPGRFEPSAP